MQGDNNHPPGAGVRAVRYEIKIEQEHLTEVGRLATASGVDPNVILNGWIKVGRVTAALLPVVGFLAEIHQGGRQLTHDPGPPPPAEKKPTEVDPRSSEEFLSDMRKEAGPALAKVPATAPAPDQPEDPDRTVAMKKPEVTS